MRREAHLADLIGKVSRRTLLLRELVRYRTLPISGEDERFLSYVAIETLNLWVLFARSFFLSTALQARTSTGAKITIRVPGIKTEEDALTFAVHIERPWLRSRPGPWTHREEPNWLDRAVLDRVTAALLPSNIASLRRGLAYTTRALQDLPTFRNYYAHKGKETADKARSLARAYALSPTLRPSELLTSRQYGRPQCILADWLDDIRNVVELTS